MISFEKISNENNMPRIKIPYWEMDISASCSSGPGGQNVNKTATKITLKFNVGNSKSLTEEQKEIISRELANRINKEGEIVISEQSARSQHTNRKTAVKKLTDMINEALIPEAERVATKVPRMEKEKRIKGKKKRSEIKKGRGRVEIE